MEKDKPFTIQALLEVIPTLKGIYEKSEGDGKRLEGLVKYTGVLWRNVPEKIEIYEGLTKFIIDLKEQKTGFYSDQRDNRILIGNLSKDKEFLDICSYTDIFLLKL